MMETRIPTVLLLRQNLVTAMAIAGDLGFNPLTDKLTNENGEEVMLEEPQGIEMPIKGFAVEDAGYIEPYARWKRC